VSSRTFKVLHYAALKSLRLYKVQHSSVLKTYCGKLKGRNCGGFKRHNVYTTFLTQKLKGSHADTHDQHAFLCRLLSFHNEGELGKRRIKSIYDEQMFGQEPTNQA